MIYNHIFIFFHYKKLCFYILTKSSIYLKGHCELMQINTIFLLTITSIHEHQEKKWVKGFRVYCLIPYNTPCISHTCMEVQQPRLTFHLHNVDAGMSLHSSSIYICIVDDKTQMHVEWACPNIPANPWFPSPTIQPYCLNLLGLRSHFCFIQGHYN